jgi:hypothetical protein
LVPNVGEIMCGDVLDVYRDESSDLVPLVFVEQIQIKVLFTDPPRVSGHPKFQRMGRVH